MFPTDTELDARVLKGARILDARYPGWELDVDLRALDVSDTQFCVAAQIVCHSDGDGAYMGAMDQLGLDVDDDRMAHGFTLGTKEIGVFAHRLNDAERTEVFAPLTDAWKRLITARLAELEATR
jgi:hypothetical protein